MRLVIVLLLVGFPIALVLAWAFDVTPSGIRATPNVAISSHGSAVSGHRRRNIFLLLGAGLAIAITAGFFLLPRVGAEGREVDRDFALRNFSDDKSNAYFADGIRTTSSPRSRASAISR